jgi:toxin-antitoxin system PIN domain toxin
MSTFFQSLPTLPPEEPILVYAHRAETAHEKRVLKWFEEQLKPPRTFAMSELVLSGFVRIVTNRKIFPTPTTLVTALAEVERIWNLPNCVRISPGAKHFDEFVRLCRDGRVTGKLVADAYLAALATESGCTWITFDRDFARFPGLDWQEPDLSIIATP